MSYGDPNENYAGWLMPHGHRGRGSMLRPDAPPLAGGPGVPPEDDERIARRMRGLRFADSAAARSADRGGRKPVAIDAMSAASPLADL